MVAPIGHTHTPASESAPNSSEITVPEEKEEAGQDRIEGSYYPFFLVHVITLVSSIFVVIVFVLLEDDGEVSGREVSLLIYSKKHPLR